MALTKFIDHNVFPEQIDRFVEENPNVKYMGLKTMHLGNADSKQANWLRRHLMGEDEMSRFYESMYNRFASDEQGFKVGGINVHHRESGDWGKYVIVSGGRLMRHNGTELSIKDMEEMSKLKTTKDAEPVVE